MTKHKKKIDFSKLRAVLPYVVAGVLTFLVVFFGSIDKQSSDVSLSLDTFAAEDYKVSVDQLSELYMVADLSDALGLASASDVASNYVVTTTMYDAGQTSTGKLEKPNITNIADSRGVIEYAVGEGESMDSIAAKYGVTTDEIRWSNGLKTTDVTVGSVLYVPSKSGIVYTVKAGDSIESIVEKYGSSVEEIVALNDLEVSGISEGMKILVKGGSLPEKERPEYVAPVVVARPTYTYTYLGDTSERLNIEVIGYNYYGGGQCVGYAAWYRNVSGLSNLAPVNQMWGNARNWAGAARAAGFLVNNTPEVNAVFQTTSGWYGHVGIVVGINPDGSIVVQEANYNYVPGRITRATIPADKVGNFNYIH